MVSLVARGNIATDYFGGRNQNAERDSRAGKIGDGRRGGDGVIQEPPAVTSAQIGVGDVLLDHALGVEEGAVDGDGVEHHFQVFFAFVVEEWKDDVFEFVVERFSFARVVGGSVRAAMQF